MMLRSLVCLLKRLVPWVSSQREPTVKQLISFGIPYAREGEVVTCENGHPVCEFVQTVFMGDMQDLENQLGFWHQPKPEVGQLEIPRCAKCNGRFYISGGIMHLKDGWRDPYGMIEKYGFPEE
jgi:hypothetical protein